MRIVVKFGLMVLTSGFLAQSAFATTGSDSSLKPSQVTPAMMTKYDNEKDTIEKKPNCNQVESPVLGAFCERPILKSYDGKIRDLLKQIADKRTQYPQFNVEKDQADWLQRHDQCISDKDLKMCLELSYMERYSQLMAQFEMVPKDGPLAYQCGDDKDVQLTFYATDLPTVIVRYHNEFREAFMGPLSKGVNYTSHNLKVTERKLAATIYWDDKTLQCDQINAK